MSALLPSGTFRKLLLEEQSVLQQLQKAKEAFANIPPDRRMELGIDDLFIDTCDVLEYQRERVTQRETHVEKITGKKKPHEDKRAQKLRLETFEEFIEGIQGIVNDVPEYKQPAKLSELLNDAAMRPYTRHNQLHLRYDVDEELLTLNSRDGELFSLYGEEAFGEVKLSLERQDWFGPVKPTTTDDSGLKPLESAELSRIKMARPCVIIGKLFAAYYNALSQKDREVYHYRVAPDKDSIFLTAYGRDIVGYKLSNISWPHMVKQRDRQGKVSFVEKGDWTVSTPSERNVIREHFVVMNGGLGHSYFSPLIKEEIFLGRKKPPRYRPTFSSGVISTDP